MKLEVAYCIYELTKITALDVPYHECPNRKVFKLIVFTFKILGDRMRQSHVRYILILEMIARIRLSMVILNLDYEELIIEMFKHFLESIRLQYKNILSYMEIMTPSLYKKISTFGRVVLSSLGQCLKR